jgi:hypothetical protein
MSITEADVSRDATSKARQHAEQLFIVKNVGDTNITLKFSKNAFRKHFAVTSRKGTQHQGEKITNRALQRYSLGKQYEDERNNTQVPGRSQLKKRYGVGTDVNAIIDLTRCDINIVMTEIAKKMKDHQWQLPNGTENIDVHFSVACIVKTKVDPLERGETDNQVHHSPTSQQASFRVKRFSSSYFELFHMTAA